MKILKQDEIELSILRDLRRKSGLSMDFWADLTEGLDYRSLAILYGNSDLLPKYKKSKDRP